jgi:endo-1,4-beta-mannosidase
MYMGTLKMYFIDFKCNVIYAHMYVRSMYVRRGVAWCNGHRNYKQKQKIVGSTPALVYFVEVPDIAVLPVIVT